MSRRDRDPAGARFPANEYRELRVRAWYNRRGVTVLVDTWIRAPGSPWKRVGTFPLPASEAAALRDHLSDVLDRADKRDRVVYL